MPSLLSGGSQFKITVNDTIIINRIDAETGDRIRIEKASLIWCYVGGRGVDEMDDLSIVAGKSGTSEQKRATKKSKGHFFHILQQ